MRGDAERHFGGNVFAVVRSEGHHHAFNVIVQVLVVNLDAWGDAELQVASKIFVVLRSVGYRYVGKVLMPARVVNLDEGATRSYNFWVQYLWQSSRVSSCCQNT